MVSGVQQFEAAADIDEADAGFAGVVVVGIGTREDQPSIGLFEADDDIVGLAVVAGGVFECVLDEGDEEQWGDLAVGVGDIDLQGDGKTCVGPGALEGDIVLEVGDFLVQIDLVRVGLVQIIAKEIGELHDHIAGLAVLTVDGAVDGVEAVEQEVGVDLGTEVFEFGLELADLDVADVLPLFGPALGIE